MFISPFDTNFLIFIFMPLIPMVAGGIALAKKAKQTNASKAQSLSSSNSDEERDRLFEESGLSDDFRDRWNSAWSSYNPNLVEDTFWDQASNFFGARSKADVARLELLQKRNDALNQLVNQKGEQDYNSEAEQIRRLRAAGQNVDLQGGVDPSEATEGHEPEQPISFDGLSTGADLAKGFSQAFMSAITMYSSLQGIARQSIDLQLKQAGKFGQFQGFAEDVARSLLSSSDIVDMIDSAGKGEAYSFAISPETFAKHGIKSKRLQKIIGNHVQSMLTSVRGDLFKYKSLDDFLKNQKSVDSERSAWYRSGQSSIFDDPSIISALKAFYETEHDIAVKELELSDKVIESGKAKAGYLSSYYYNSDGKAVAQSEKAAAEFKKYVIDKKKELYNKLLTDRHGNEKTSMFSLMLAVQLMGDVDLLGNSGVSGAVDTAMDFYNPVRKITHLK